ncbi:MAG: glutamine-hydrolyzing GMP synthase, partial [Candidatus Kapaibacteriota bacterium]
MKEKIIVLDFGSQYTQLIARKIRECGVFAEIHPYNIPFEEIKKIEPKGIVLSGGPSSVYEENAPRPDDAIFSQKIPILGICYGLQLITFHFGGDVDKAAKREYGRAKFKLLSKNPLFDNIPDESTVWMSHSDKVEKIPPGFEVLGTTENAISAIYNSEKRIYGLQFHPEVHHTEYGKQILENFVVKICGCSKTWSPQSFIETQIENIKNKVGNEEVILALSGGVDSTVCAVLLHKSIGEQLHCIHIDTGLMRENESETVLNLFRQHFQIPITLLKAEEIFLNRLKDITDPEAKRKIIGQTFIELFEK